MEGQRGGVKWYKNSKWNNVNPSPFYLLLLWRRSKGVSSQPVKNIIILAACCHLVSSPLFLKNSNVDKRNDP